MLLTHNEEYALESQHLLLDTDSAVVEKIEEMMIDAFQYDYQRNYTFSLSKLYMKKKDVNFSRSSKRTEPKIDKKRLKLFLATAMKKAEKRLKALNIHGHYAFNMSSDVELNEYKEEVLIVNFTKRNVHKQHIRQEQDIQKEKLLKVASEKSDYGIEKTKKLSETQEVKVLKKLNSTHSEYTKEPEQDSGRFSDVHGKYQSQILQLEEKVKKLEEEVQSKKSIERAQDIEDEKIYKDLEMQLETATYNLQKFEESNKQLEEQNTTYKSRIEKFERQQETTQQQIEKQAKLIEESGKNYKSVIERSKETFEKQKAEFETSMKKVTSSFKKRLQEMEEGFQKKIQELSAKNNDLLESFNAVNGVNTELAEKNNVLERSLKTQEDHNKELKELLVNSEKKIGELENELTEKNNRIFNQEGDVKKLQKELDEKGTTLSGMKKLLTQAQAHEVENLLSINSKLREKVEQLEKGKYHRGNTKAFKKEASITDTIKRTSDQINVRKTQNLVVDASEKSSSQKKIQELEKMLQEKEQEINKVRAMNTYQVERIEDLSFKLLGNAESKKEVQDANKAENSAKKESNKIVKKPVTKKYDVEKIFEFTEDFDQNYKKRKIDMNMLVDPGVSGAFSLDINLPHIQKLITNEEIDLSEDTLEQEHVAVVEKNESERMKYKESNNERKEFLVSSDAINELFETGECSFATVEGDIASGLEGMYICIKIKPNCTVKVSSQTGENILQEGKKYGVKIPKLVNFDGPIDVESAESAFYSMRSLAQIAHLQHPNLVKVLGGSEYVMAKKGKDGFNSWKKSSKTLVKNSYAFEDTDIFVVMEHVDGEELFEHFSRGDLDDMSKLEIIQALISVVSFLHKNKIFHHDIKMENIIIEKNSFRPVLIDSIGSELHKFNDDRGVVLNSPEAVTLEESRMYQKYNNRYKDITGLLFVVYNIVFGNKYSIVNNLIWCYENLDPKMRANMSNTFGIRSFQDIARFFGCSEVDISKLIKDRTSTSGISMAEKFHELILRIHPDYVPPKVVFSVSGEPTIEGDVEYDYMDILKMLKALEYNLNSMFKKNIKNLHENYAKISNWNNTIVLGEDATELQKCIKSILETHMMTSYKKNTLNKIGLTIKNIIYKFRSESFAKTQQNTISKKSSISSITGRLMQMVRPAKKKSS